MTSSDLKKLTSDQLVELLGSYNLYAVSNGGNKSAQLVDGKTMMEEIKSRLSAPRMVTTDPAVLIAPLHVHLNPLGNTPEAICGKLYDIFYDISEHDLWPLGMHDIQTMHKYISKFLHLHMGEGSFEPNDILVLSVTGEQNPPPEVPLNDGHYYTHPAPYEGWTVHVFCGNRFGSFDKELFTRQGFFNPIPPTPNKLDVI